MILSYISSNISSNLTYKPPCFHCSPKYIDTYCKKLIKSASNETDDVKSHKLYPLAQIYRSYFTTQENSCIALDYESEIKELKKIDTPLAYSFRPWFYQTCSEFGWYQTTDSKNHPFGTLAPVEFNSELCKDVFGNV